MNILNSKFVASVAVLLLSLSFSEPAAAFRCGSKLVQDGMFLVGLDIVGDKLMEINVFSPGGLNNLETLEGVPFCAEVIHAIEHKVEYRQKNQQGFSNIEISML